MSALNENTDKQELKKRKKKKLYNKRYYKKKKKKEREELKKNMPPVEKKRSVGRPKKRGPKKKRIRRKIVKNYKDRPVIDFKIVSCLNGKQNGFIGRYSTYEEAYSALSELDKKNDSVIFPREVINSENMSKSVDEFLLLEKDRDGDLEDGKIRNEYGKLVKHIIVNNSKWVIRDKISQKVEESFWVYGHDPKTDRKSFIWIYENELLGSIETKYDITRVLLYKNKIIFIDDRENLHMVICKNESDSIRFYNVLEQMVEKDKNKQIVFIGSFSAISESRRELEEKLMDLTGWTKAKIQYNHT